MLQDSILYAKATIGWGMELIQHSLFGNQPLVGAALPLPPVVPFQVSMVMSSCTPTFP